MLSDFHKTLLMDPERSSARAALQAVYPWYRHITLLKHKESIAENGLIGFYPDGAYPDDDIVALMDPGEGRIVCLHPWGSQPVRPAPNGPPITLAVAAADLPMRLGLDWSYGEVFDHAESHHRANRQRPSASIFAEVVTYYGSVASYDTIPASVLRIWEPGLPPDDPTDWPMLVC